MGPHRVVNSCTIDPPRTGRGGHERPPLARYALRSASLSMARPRVRSSSQSSWAVCNTQSIVARPLIIAAKTYQGTGFSQRGAPQSALELVGTHDPETSAD